MDHADLSVELCGLHLKNPVIAASGTFGFGAEYAKLYDLSILGGISCKGLTLAPREGNPPTRLTGTAHGMLNAVGLQNPGIEVFLQDVLPVMKTYGTAIIANVAGSSVEDYAEITAKLAGSGVDMIELNISCPNVHAGGVPFGTDPAVIEEVTRRARQNAGVPLMVKLTPNVTSIADCAKAAEQGGADAVSLINTFTGMAIDPVTRRIVIKNKTAGYSGPAVKPLAVRMVYQAARAVGIPVVGMGGIMTPADVVEFMLAGATAVMVGTANLLDPFALPIIIDGLQRFCVENGIETLRSLTGAVRED